MIPPCPCGVRNAKGIAFPEEDKGFPVNDGKRHSVSEAYRRLEWKAVMRQGVIKVPESDS